MHKIAFFECICREISVFDTDQRPTKLLRCGTLAFEKDYAPGFGEQASKLSNKPQQGVGNAPLGGLSGELALPFFTSRKRLPSAVVWPQPH
ncbi:MAG: hypothetical protein JO163_20435 [Methylobacteriaceae bacterium]|nr:hypothetical protein [Methylobacteriaceae bacterium]